ncbi:mucin-5AC-like [Antennarius striatus]|uniref:mucin-5AC-like n=1 Tax=Antennarius striatus TaxID=241820 RepID=UPI0035B184D8
MTAGVNLLFCALTVLTGASWTRGQSDVSPPISTLVALLTSASPHLTQGPGNEASEWTQYPPDRDDTFTRTTTATRTEETIQSETNAGYKTHLLTTGFATLEPKKVPGFSTLSPPDSLSSTLAPRHPSVTAPTRRPPTTFSSQSGVTTGSALQSPPPTSGRPSPSRAGGDPAGPTNQDVPPVLNVGDEDPKSLHSSSPLDPMLAALMSVFIVTTAIFFTFLFLRIRQRTNRPEFHRLQDLPMDDLMEDTPLSRYSY